MPDEARVPPHDEGAERSVLGSVLLDHETAMNICAEQGVVTETFYESAHQLIWRCMHWLHTHSRPIDGVTVADVLRRYRVLDEAGGTTYLDSLIDATPTSVHCEHYVSLVVAKHKARQAIASLRDTEAALYAGEEPDVVLPPHLQSIVNITETRQGETKHAVMDRMMKRAWRIRDGEISGLPTPWTIFNQRIGGPPFGKPTIIAGLEGGRKSYLVVQWAVHASVACGIPGVLYALEDGIEDSLTRAACIIAGVSHWSMFTRGRFTQEEADAVEEAGRRIADSPLHIEDDIRGIDQLRSHLARGVAKHGWRFAFLDGFKDLDAQGEGSSEQELYKNRSIAQMSRKHNVAFVAIHHINGTILDEEQARGFRGKKGSAHEYFIPYRSITGRKEIVKSARLIIMLQSRPFKNDKGGTELTDFCLDVQKFTGGRTGCIRMVVNDDTGLFTEHPDDIKEWNNSAARI